MQVNFERDFGKYKKDILESFFSLPDVDIASSVRLPGKNARIFPHVHFLVINKEGTSPIPISFAEVPGGVPFAGRFYESGNGRVQ